MPKYQSMSHFVNQHRNEQAQNPDQDTLQPIRIPEHKGERVEPENRVHSNRHAKQYEIAKSNGVSPAIPNIR